MMTSSLAARIFTVALIAGSLAACASEEGPSSSDTSGGSTSMAPVAGNATVIDAKLLMSNGKAGQYEYTVKLDGGRDYIKVLQSSDTIIGNNKRVQVIKDSNGRTRIVPANA